MPSERAVKIAKHGPLLSLVAVAVAVILGAGVAQVLGLSVEDLLAMRSVPLLFGGAFLATGLIWLYQSQFIIRHTDVAMEHDVEPPSKYDLSYGTTLGAWRNGLLALLGALIALAWGVGVLVRTL